MSGKIWRMNKKNSIKLFENKAWMCAINYGHANGSTEYSDNARHKMFLNNIYPIVITCESNYRHRFKIELAPIMCLSQCAVENELHKENINLPKIVGLL